MVLKPSEIAPLSAYIYAEILHEAGVPAGVFNLVNGDGPTVGTALSVHPDVDMMSFTGSTRAGSLVAQNAAPTVKRVTQELGGKSPNIILEDADLEAAVTRGVLHMYNNTGQSCNAPSRMLVPRAKLAEAEAIAARVTETMSLLVIRPMRPPPWVRLFQDPVGQDTGSHQQGYRRGRQAGVRWSGIARGNSTGLLRAPDSIFRGQ